MKGEWRPVGERTEFPGVSIRHTDSRRPPLLPVLLDALKLLSMAWEVLPPRQQPADETTQAEG
ncbi:MAG TPA: hypothetical protein PLD23_00115 [Armatimonadota bacterium]|nr:hypothetical protein [Armatimonadota bacterium]HQK91877.1 hypothetical protein [Armatimonadota bacterium]